MGNCVCAKPYDENKDKIVFVPISNRELLDMTPKISIAISNEAKEQKIEQSQENKLREENTKLKLEIQTLKEKY